MTPERWQQVDELFKAALEIAPEGRAAFVKQACAGDEALREEIESLLSSYNQEDSFLETPAVAAAAHSLLDENAESLVGRVLGHYQVITFLAEGGMGQVYLAEDTTLGRRVALKLLPGHLSNDADRLRRFAREARAASALNHPNVCVIHEVGETEDRCRYIVMEYVEGVTLRQRMSESRLPLSEVLDISMQMAAALAAAHEVGIVHRDIKPGNVMLRRDGLVKVLDFGLAKLTEKQPAASPAMVMRSDGKTDTGIVIGTTAYMSPEQARGLALDFRTDIWSLGVVLYEMVTGEVPFKGETTSDIIVSILEREPELLTQVAPGAPAELQRIISKSLHKEREGRYQTAMDLLLNLKSLKQDLEFEHSLQSGSSGSGKLRTSATVSATRPQPRWWVNRWLRLSGVVILVVGVTVWLYSSRPPSENLTRPSPESSLPPMKVEPLTSFAGYEGCPAFSPDGKQLAFSWNGEKEDNFDIYVKLINAGTPLRLTTHPGIDSSPTWSPDGRYIAFSRFDKGECGIFMVPALGGPERKLLSFETKWFVRDPPLVDWSPDGKYLAFTDKPFIQGGSSILLLSLENLEKQRLMSPPENQGDWHPAFSPDSQTLAFTRWIRYGVGDIYLAPVRGGEPKRLTFDDQPIGGLDWTEDGQSIVFLSSRGNVGPCLWKISAAGGSPEPLAICSNNPGQGMHFSISRQGHLLAYAIGLDDRNIWRMGVPGSAGQPTVPVKLIASSLDDGGAQFSPDGNRIAFESVRSGTLQVWVCEADGSNPIQLTSIGESFSGRAYGSGSPFWSPDGRQIVFDAAVEVNNDDIRHIHVVDAAGGPPRPITTGASYDGMPSWSRDGRWIYFASNRGGAWQVWKVPVEGGEAVQLTKNGGFRAVESPDGKFVYYSKQDDPGLWRVPVGGGEESLILAQLEKGYFHAWAVASRGIYFIHPEPKPPAVIEFFSFATRRVTRIASLEKESFQWGSTLSITPDERWLLYTQRDQSGSDIMLVENFR